MKSDSNFKFPKAMKSLLSTSTSKDHKRLWKDALISAQLNIMSKTFSYVVMNYDVTPAKARQILAKG